MDNKSDIEKKRQEEIEARRKQIIEPFGLVAGTSPPEYKGKMTYPGSGEKVYDVTIVCLG